LIKIFCGGLMSGISESDDVFYDLVNLTADEWNQSVADTFDYTVDGLRSLVTSRSLAIANERTHVEVERTMIGILAEIQQDDDKNNVIEYNDTPDEDVLYRATLLDKFTIDLHGGDEEINSIALTGKIIIGLDFSEGDFSSSYFCHCIFYNCIFDNSNLERMTIVNCTFTRCSFRSVDFTSSVIGRCKFFETTLDEASFDYTNITDCSFVVSSVNYASFIQSKILYTGFSDVEGNNSDWKDTDVVQCSFSNTQLSNCDFKRATLVDDMFIRVDLSGCDFSAVTVTCLTVTMTLVPEEFREFFEVNHLLYSPSVFEWEPNPETDEVEDTPSIEDIETYDEDEEDDEDRPW
jgi:uncharacterized protein YjbI with pentapeptide repeats